MAKAIFCGSGKKQNDEWLTVSINVDKIQEHTFEYNGVRYVKLNINIKDQEDQYGKDVSVSINEYKKDK